MNAAQRQIHFVATLKTKVGVGLILCLFLNFIIIVLEPFGTDQFEADYRLLLLFGFGVVMFGAYIIHSSIENVWYFRKGKVWLVSYEIISTILFLLFSGTMLYLYNTVIVNQLACTLETYRRYLLVTVLSMVPVFVPAMLYLRQKFGERIVPLPKNSYLLTGENKNEILRLEKDDLLFIKAVENYVEICFVDNHKKVISKTFRQTLSNVAQQLPFLEKCHRSYLVNISAIKEIIGNTQSATISFVVGEKEIPLSKTYYKHLKNRVP